MTAHDFAALRAELDLPRAEDGDAFPAAVAAEAARVAAAPPPASEDLTHLPFVTIDPPESLDLDQAVLVERAGDGFVVRYAIADLGSALPPGGAVDLEARRRGQTIYLPDGRVPLHPPVLSEGALSLLPEQVRGAAVWTVEVGADGAIGAASVRRARVRSVARLDYARVQSDADAGTPHPSIEALGDLGRLRRRVRLAAGAIDLALPEQGVVPEGQDWALRIEPRTEADAWNAEVSLLTGMAAATMMLGAGVGLLRTLPAPDDHDLTIFARTADRLGVARAEGATPGEVLAALNPAAPVAMALMTHATKLLRGAGYAAFDGSAPDEPTHAGVGGPYAHVTAPLRRLADRFGTEVCLAVSGGEPVPDWVRAALPDVVEAMSAGGRRASTADRGAVDLVEVWTMQRRREETFAAVVVESDDDGADVILTDPPIEARCTGSGLADASIVEVRVARIDVSERRVVYERAEASS